MATVSDVIAALQMFPPDLPVVLNQALSSESSPDVRVSRFHPDFEIPEDQVVIW